MYDREIIRPGPSLDLGSAVGAPVSPAVRANGFIFTSGYVAMDPESGVLVNGSIEEETELTLLALKRVLESAGSSLDKVVKVFVFLADLERDFEGMNRVYARFFKHDYPARRTVQAKIVNQLKVEIDAIAME